MISTGRGSNFRRSSTHSMSRSGFIGSKVWTISSRESSRKSKMPWRNSFADGSRSEERRVGKEGWFTRSKRDWSSDVCSSDLFLLGVKKPKLIVQATDDQYGPRKQLQALFDSLDEPKRLHWVEGVDHFFEGKLEEVQNAVAEFLRGWF